MNPDLSTREDIITLVDAFYTEVQQNEIIAPFFNDVAKVDWSKHLPKMYDFWEFILLGSGSYKGNVTTPHIQLNEKKSLYPEHFNEWLRLFHTTVDAHFAGRKAEEAKSRASAIAGVMSHKIEESRQ